MMSEERLNMLYNKQKYSKEHDSKLEEILPVLLSFLCIMLPILQIAFFIIYPITYESKCIGGWSFLEGLFEAIKLLATVGILLDITGILFSYVVSSTGKNNWFSLPLLFNSSLLLIKLSLLIPSFSISL